ncbi:MAG: hypothetical protein ABI925_06700 [Verrucomicrobiota bacterium]
MTKTKLLLFAIALSLLIPAAAKADRIQIQIGDRPFYSHGDRYWAGEYEMVWIPGHMSRFGHHWIHGQYIRSTTHHRHVNFHRDNDYRVDYRR